MQKKRLAYLGVILPFAIAAASWGFKRYDASKLDTDRFVTDSINRRYELTEIRGTVKDILCVDHPNHWRCRAQ